MRTISIAAGSMMLAASMVAFADQERECWNQGAGHYEAVRPGERQNDLNFNNCRSIGEAPRDTKRWNSGGEECWNPHANHFEGVRSGERQDDLDFSRCRQIRDSNQRVATRECWNQGAGHYEAVRPGERQGDLDFSRCR
jgi:hypothetical protein